MTSHLEVRVISYYPVTSEMPQYNLGGSYIVVHQTIALAKKTPIVMLKKSVEQRLLFLYLRKQFIYCTLFQGYTWVFGRSRVGGRFKSCPVFITLGL